MTYPPDVSMMNAAAAGIGIYIPAPGNSKDKEVVFKIVKTYTHCFVLLWKPADINILFEFTFPNHFCGNIAQLINGIRQFPSLKGCCLPQDDYNLLKTEM
jgi:hypothetical protein